jgi:hypothetical protein
MQCSSTLVTLTIAAALASYVLSARHMTVDDVGNFDQFAAQCGTNSVYAGTGSALQGLQGDKYACIENSVSALQRNEAYFHQATVFDQPADAFLLRAALLPLCLSCCLRCCYKCTGLTLSRTASCC